MWLIGTCSCILELWLFSKICISDRPSWNTSIKPCSVGRFEPATFPFGESILSNRPYRQSDSNGFYYSLIIKTTSSIHFNTAHANLIEQTTSSIELVVLKRRIIFVIRTDSRCLLLHRLEQHRRLLLSKGTYRTLAQPADPCGNPFRDMIWKILNPTFSGGFTLHGSFSKRAFEF